MTEAHINTRIEKLEEISNLLLRAEELIGDYVKQEQDGEDLQQSIESAVDQCQEFIDTEKHKLESEDFEPIEVNYKEIVEQYKEQGYVK
jgi:ribosome-associated translation inhibitor RaiA